MSVLHFLSYHNAVPIAVSIVLLGAGATFAATNPEAIYSQSQEVLSIDNTYLVGKDLSSYSPRTQIVTVTEDSENYYVEYVLYTIDLEDYVWKDIAKSQMMKVSKAALGPYRDLGVYVTGQLKENIDEEVRRLTETQAIEKKNVSYKVVATAYGGLVGKMLDTTTEALPGYTPVVIPPPPPPEPQVAAAAEPGNLGTSEPASTPQQEAAPTQEPQQEEGAPTIDILGNNPARIPMGSTYADLGAVITGPTPVDMNLGLHVFVDDVEVQTPSIDTSAVKTWTIRYEATNAAGKKGYAIRTVEVYDPYPPAEVPAPESASTTESATPESAPAQTESTSTPTSASPETSPSEVQVSATTTTP